MLNPRMVTEPGAPANYVQLESLRKSLPTALPAEYEEFLKTYNGCVPLGAPLVIPFLEIQDRVIRFRGIRRGEDPFALRPGELKDDEVPEPEYMLVIADTKLGNPLALCLSANDYGAIYYIMRNVGARTSGTFALQRAWRIFDTFGGLCSNLLRPSTTEMTPNEDVTMDLGSSRYVKKPDLSKSDPDSVTGLWTRFKR